MTAATSRPLAPNANNPRLLRRVIGWLARGVRSSRALHETLGVDLRTIQYYLQAGEWLGLIEPGPERLLTAVGLEVALGPHPDRAYARAVWAQPMVADLMAGRAPVCPSLDEVAIAIARAEPDLAPATIRRRASAVRSLIAPALDAGPTRSPEHLQLVLPLVPRAPGVPPTLAPPKGSAADPEIYRFVLGCLLDHGEMTLGQLRALLDRAGARELPIGAYIDLAMQRADATREGERLVITPGAVARREVASTTAGVILSHPGYRTWMQDLREAAGGDRRAEIRVEQTAARFRAWDLRLFGQPADPATLDRALNGVVLDRSPDRYPLAGDPGPAPDAEPAPWIDRWDAPDVIVCLPPALEALRGGLPAINAALAAARQGVREVAPPDVATRPVRVHGGLLHPGEPLPRSVPDLISLRQRALLHAPYAGTLAALLLLNREEPERFTVRVHRGRPAVLRRGRSLGPLLQVLDTFFIDRGQVASRRPGGGGLSAADLLAGLVAIGVVADLGGVFVLDERLFHRLRTEPEQIEVHALLRPVADALEQHLTGLEPLEPAERR